MSDDASIEVASVKAAAALYGTYSLLLLYCGSCSPELYADVIRPQMVRADPAFNGRWARDYQPIEPLMRALQDSNVPDTFDELFTAATENGRIHRLVAGRLVPDGQSLLRSSGRDRERPPTDREREIYDKFFDVGHQRPSSAESAVLLQQHLSSVRSDLLADPLPVPCGWGGLRLGDAALIDRFHRDSISILDHPSLTTRRAHK